MLDKLVITLFSHCLRSIKRLLKIIQPSINLSSKQTVQFRIQNFGMYLQSNIVKMDKRCSQPPFHTFKIFRALNSHQVVRCLSLEMEKRSISTYCVSIHQLIIFITNKNVDSKLFTHCSEDIHHQKLMIQSLREIKNGLLL